MCEARLSEDAVQPTTAAVFVASEVAPWSKTGGLADVMSALPAALVARGHRVMTVSPRYSNYHNAVDTGLEAPVAGAPLPNPQQQLAPSSPTHSQPAQAHPHLLQLEMPEAHASAPGLPIHRPQAS
ncbi:glyco_transf_5 domain-containing protein, partial [Haematococcus lacustris]